MWLNLSINNLSKRKKNSLLKKFFQRLLKIKKSISNFFGKKVKDNIILFPAYFKDS